MRSKLTKIGAVSVTAAAIVVLAVMLTLAAAGAEITAQADTVTDLSVKAGQPVTGNDAGVCVEAYNQYNLIRFHVIANSDSERDQALKRKVRDLIVREMTSEFSKAKNLDDARKIAQGHLEEIESIAAEEVKAWGEDYPVNVQLGNFDFPVKSYGDLTLPAGNYEAVRVVIGHGQGANWWCVLFPPLCFIDVSRSMGAPEPEAGFFAMEAVTASAVYEQSSVEKGPEDPEVELLDPEKDSGKHESSKENYKNIKVRFKIIELFGGIFS
ncbi:stage II sporulation protein R [Phosphitispora fastidiosa]|uniref:stage II sporulation protein R n=1 Tax=Phosphitispora fastidiosa TaxID=2837202 RepID=UPI001E5C8EC4|nr:stage II sporulation protein R [Phosphitispora fastidiosa]MBU7005601.1 stage II sporulation protein R [Phosphitispora fastidiosa]